MRSTSALAAVFSLSFALACESAPPATAPSAGPPAPSSTPPTVAPSSQPKPPTADAVAAADLVGKAAPDFTLNDLGG